MEYRDLGNTGMKISHMSFGASSVGGHFGAVDPGEGVRVVNRALEAGINLIDTAPWYGKSEQVLGQALAGETRSSYYLSTKVGRYLPQVDKMFDFTAQRTLDSVDNSLSTMGQDYVDIIQIHDVEFAPSIDMIISETLPALQKVKEAGKARFIGITGYPLKTLREIIEKSHIKIDVVLPYCHLTMNDSSLLDHLQYFKEKDIGVINAAPLAMALLSPQGPPKWHPAPEPIKQAASKALTLCEERGVSLPSLALHHALEVTDVPTTLVGAANVNILEANLGVLGRPLTELERTTKEEIMERYMKPLNNMTWEGIELRKYQRKLAELRIKTKPIVTPLIQRPSDQVMRNIEQAC